MSSFGVPPTGFGGAASSLGRTAVQVEPPARLNATSQDSRGSLRLAFTAIASQAEASEALAELDAEFFAKGTKSAKASRKKA
eukprot:4521742-Amphidinium_carterae.2